MIKISDFSESTKAIYKECRKGERAIYDLVETLINSDFDKKEIKQFLRSKFKHMASFYEEWFNL